MGRAMMLGLALGAFYYFILFDKGTTQVASIQNSQNRVQELQKEIQENQRKLDRAAVFKKSAAEVGNTIHKLLAMIPEKFGMPDLMKIVSNESKVAGSSLVNMTPIETVVSPSAKEFEELSIRVELIGTFLQHMVFLSNLTKINQILIAKKLDLSVLNEGKGDEAPSVKLETTLVAYRYRGAAVTGAPAAPGAQAQPNPGTSLPKSDRGSK